MPMTMYEVARRAGVSQATVSRVLSGANFVSSEATESVSRAMRELGYKHKRRRSSIPSNAAPADEGGVMVASRHHSRAVTPKSGVIALLMLDKSMDSHPALVLEKMRGAEQAVAREGLGLVIGFVGAAGQVPPVVQREELIGVLLWGRSITPQLKSAIKRVPSVWLSSHADTRGRRILAGNEQAGQLAAKHLLDCGVQRPALLSLPTLFTQCERRGNAFRYALHLVGVEARCISGEPGGRPFEDLDRAEQVVEMDRLIDQLLQEDSPPDGLFVPDDLFVSLAYASLSRRGIRPMVDIRIVSCSNESSCLAGLHPRPATIDMGAETTGRLAVEQLLCEIRNPGAAEGVAMLIEPRLVPGEEAEQPPEA